MKELEEVLTVLILVLGLALGFTFLFAVFRDLHR
jgi:hypothetical protein